jgi:hypothetical protein
VTQDEIDNEDALQFDYPADTSAAADVVNDTFSYLQDADGAPCDFVSILSHRGNSIASLELEIQWSNESVTWAPLELVKKDQPAMVAKYVLAHTISCDTSGLLARWARVALQALKRAIRRIRRAYRFPSKPENAFSLVPWGSLPFKARVRRSTGLPVEVPAPKTSKGKRKTKKGRNNRHQGEVKYGVAVPRNVREALHFDEENGDLLWTDAMSKEIMALQKLKCFRVQEQRNWKPKEQGYQ